MKVFHANTLSTKEIRDLQIISMAHLDLFSVEEVETYKV